MNEKELLAQIEALKASNNQLKAKIAKKQAIRFKVSDKKACSVYGLNNRFPVTLYKQQWERLLAHTDELKKFLEDNSGALAIKED